MYSGSTNRTLKVSNEVLVEGSSVSIRKLNVGDLERIVEHGFSVSIVEPLTEIRRLIEVYSETGMWLDDSGAFAIVNNATRCMVGTTQYFRSSHCIHGFELGYIIHDSNDRGNGYAAEGVRLVSDYLFSTMPKILRQQLIIEVGNTPSWKVAERCGFIREGVMRSSGFGVEPADSFLYSRIIKDYEKEYFSSNEL